MNTLTLKVEPLSGTAFAPFGEVLESEGARNYRINEGTTTRFHDLARIDTTDAGGRTIASIFRGQPYRLPMTIRLLERHPLSSQAFMPLERRRWLAVVAPPADVPDPKSIRAFVCGGTQGVNYARGVWHHPLIALDDISDFLVIDRDGPGENCDIAQFADPPVIDRL
jgi:ureidoglycolate lyase